MKLHILSDLHVEFEKFTPPQTEADVVVLAGDIHEVAGYHATQVMTDYRKIRVSPQYRKLRSADTAAIHNQSLKWLFQAAVDLKDRKKKSVIVTHHAPSGRSLPDRYQDDILSASYVSHLDDFVKESSAALWIHGHIHTQQDYVIGNTRIVCNPRGYPNEPNDRFVPDFVIEV